MQWEPRAPSAEVTSPEHLALSKLIVTSARPLPDFQNEVAQILEDFSIEIA